MSYVLAQVELPTFTVGRVTVEWALALYLIALVAVDLTLRWIAFAQVESAAIDIAFFSLGYNGLEALRATEESTVHSQRLVYGLLIVLVLIAVHRWAVDRQYKKYERLLDELLQQDPDNRHIRDLSRVGKWALLLALAPAKPGKKERRDELRDALKHVLKDSDAEGSVLLDEFDQRILLEDRERRGVLAIFALLGAIAILLPVITIT